jgi:hypothetical protein
MTRTEYKLLIFKESRILAAIFLFAAGFIWPILFSTKITNPLLGWITAITVDSIFVYLLGYYCYGKLIILIENDYMSFFWQRKFAFNYKRIEPVRVSEINQITIDEDIILRKIIAGNRSISINNTRPSKWMRSDSIKLISHLRNQIPELKINDSWDDFADKGFLKIALKINSLILIVSFIVMLLFIINKGFHSKYLLFLIFTIPQLTLYQIQMRQKANKRDK